jgi:nucleoid-associated protein YgaU
MSGLERAILANTVTGDRITVQFNPEEYTVGREINFAQVAVPGLSAPVVQFVNGNAQTLTMELLVDTLEKSAQATAGSDVRELVKKITGFMDIEPSLHAPPPLVFTWGTFTFTCVLAKASQRFVMFKPDGTPVRARLSVTFNEFRNVELEAKEVKRETADYTKAHTVVEGDSLATIAWRAYGDPAAWRAIALANRIDDPRSLVVGASLVLPRLPYRDSETGELFGAAVGAIR